MLTIKISKTNRYSQGAPHLPLVNVFAGAEYKVPEQVPKHVADRIVELEGGEIIQHEDENPEQELEGAEFSEPMIEIKDEPRKSRAKRAAR